MRYAVVIEKSKRNYSAYVPDLPGCIATGRSLALAKRRITDAVRFHVEGLMADGHSMPRPTTAVGVVRVRRPP